METNEYLDFDEAVLFLKTTPSTLYKWLQADKIPGHKLGRQWRFLKEELELHISGKAPKIQMQKEALALSELLYSRSKNKREEKVDAQLNQLSEKLIWDAFDHGSHIIHIYPSKGRYEISYRNQEGLEKLTTIQEEFFQQLDKSLQDNSNVVHNDEDRRMYLQRNDDESVQVRYQRLETVTGPRLTLRLWKPDQTVLPLDKISDNKETLATFKKWMKADHGIVVATGPAGSGKTTTIYSFLNELKNQGRVVFTIEDSASVVIDGVNQIELKSRKPEDFEKSFEQIYSSDPDVICFGLGSSLGFEASLFAMAYRAASTGHLVVIQMDAASPSGALAEIKKFVPYQIENLIVGICSQQLTRENNKTKVQYSFLS